MNARCLEAALSEREGRPYTLPGPCPVCELAVLPLCDGLLRSWDLVRCYYVSLCDSVEVREGEGVAVLQMFPKAAKLGVFRRRPEALEGVWLVTADVGGAVYSVDRKGRVFYKVSPTLWTPMGAVPAAVVRALVEALGVRDDSN